MQSDWSMRKSAVSELLEPSCRAAGLNFCVTLGGSETLQPAPRFPCCKMSKNTALARQFITHYHVLTLMQAKEFNFWPGGEKIQREGPLAGRAALRDPFTFSPWKDQGVAALRPAGQGSRRIERAKVDLRPLAPPIMSDFW